MRNIIPLVIGCHCQKNLSNLLQNRIELKGKFTGMTVKELKKFIEHLPDDMDVMVEQSNDESRYGMAQSAVAMEVSFQDEDILKDEWPYIECLVISDEF